MSTLADQTPDIPLITLHDGSRIPQIGLGVLRIDDEGVVPVVESALAIGYRHIDGAAGYNNEEGVGRALAATGYNTGEQRESLWMTTIPRCTRSTARSNCCSWTMWTCT